MQNKLSKLLEALLFAYGEPVSKSKLVKITGEKRQDVESALQDLASRLMEKSGLRILSNADEVQIVTAKEYGPLIEKMYSARRKEELSRASLEVLAIIGYSGPVSRSEIEEIRGVNSAYIVRSLLMRGLIENSSKNGGDSFVLSMEALKRLGLSRNEDLPDWFELQKQIEDARKLLSNTTNA